MTEAAPLESSPHRIMIRHDGPPWKRSKTTVVGYNISLPNGSSCRVLGEWVLELKVQAQEQLQKPFLQLCSPEGCILDPNKKCDSYDDLQENATITAIAQQPKVAATNCAFSLWCRGGSRVLSWGHHKSGGDAAGVMQSLINVVDMKATEHAFAAILGSGKVVTWGDAESGGDSSMVQDRLQHVQKVFATDRAFAAVLKDGGVVTWGCALHGGDSATVQRLLTGVQDIVCTESAFAAITADEKVITWGNPECGGDSGTLQLHHVKHVQSTKAAFAALLGDGTVVAWGFSIYGGNTEPIAHVKTILLTKCAFAVALPFGHVKIWGCDGNDVRPATRNCVAASTKLRNIIDIFSTRNAIAALQKDGTILSWRNESQEHKEIKGAVKLTGNSMSFAAILADGGVQAWGCPRSGGDCSHVQKQLCEVQDIVSTDYAFAAICEGGKVVTWGNYACGGDSSQVQNKLQKDIQSLHATCRAFTAISKDGSIITWGHATYGGDSMDVCDQFRYL